MSKYTALTIGPIFSTILKAKKTRQVWASSFFFSFIISKIVKLARDKQWGLILPSDDGLNKNVYGAGLYGDRLYFQSDTVTVNIIKNGFKAILEEIASDMADKLKHEKASVNDYLDKYINLHIVELVVDEIHDNTKIEILKTLNCLLDQTELNQHFPFIADPDYLMDYLNLPINARSLISKAGFGENDKYGFPSIPEISLQAYIRGNDDIRAFVKKFDDSSEEKLFGSLEKEFKKPMFPFMKYYCVLHADGDNISQVLEQIQSYDPIRRNENLKKFSASIFDFAEKAALTIKNYGGNGIYLGGEDIMAFVPLANYVSEGKFNSVFNLVEQLDKDFKTTVHAFANNLSKDLSPTLSTGIMIAYHKHPLSEVIRESHDLLEKKAKKHYNKNNLAIKFQKHSGQFTDCIIHKEGNTSWNKILKLNEKYLADASSENAILTSIIQKFREPIFIDLFKASIDSNRLDSFIKNNLNEAPHSGKFKDFIKDVVDFANAANDEYPADKNGMDIIFTVLRIIKFINDKK